MRLYLRYVMDEISIFNQIDFRTHTTTIEPQLTAIFEGRKMTLEVGDYNLRFIALQLQYLSYLELFASLSKELTEGRVIVEVTQANGKRHVYATQEVAKLLQPNEEIEKVFEVELKEFAKLAERFSQFLAAFFIP